MKVGDVYYRASNTPILCRVVNILPNVGSRGSIVYDQYSFPAGFEFTATETLISASGVFEKSMKLLSESGQMGKWPIGSLISHRGQPYEVLGYFRRFIAVRDLGSDRLAIVRRYHKTNHRHIII